MVPFAAPPATLQVTAVFVVPVTVAVNCCGCPTGTLTAEGETDTLTFCRTVTVAEADFVGSAAEVAVTVTWGGAGGVEGAVKRPVVPIVPFSAPPATLQVTAVFVVPV